MLYLSSADSDEELDSSKFHTKSGSKANPSIDHNPLTDRKKKTYPNDEELYNYITSRPQNKVHAEHLIMEKLEKLIQNYEGKKEGENDSEEEENCVKYIILYTWLLPCECCAASIITTLKKIQDFQK